MARHVIDRDGVAGVGSTLADDPHTLHALALKLSRAVAAAEAAVAGDGPSLPAALERFGLLHARALDVVAEASAALSGDLLIVAHESRRLENAVCQAYVAGPYGSGAVQ